MQTKADVGAHSWPVGESAAGSARDRRARIQRSPAAGAVHQIFKRLASITASDEPRTLTRIARARSRRHAVFNCRWAHFRRHAVRMASRTSSSREGRGAKRSQAWALEIAATLAAALDGCTTRGDRAAPALIARSRRRRRELVEQDGCASTEDFHEGIKAYADRQLPDFQRR